MFSLQSYGPLTNLWFPLQIKYIYSNSVSGGLCHLKRGPELLGGGQVDQKVKGCLIKRKREGWNECSIKVQEWHFLSARLISGYYRSDNYLILVWWVTLSPPKKRWFFLWVSAQVAWIAFFFSQIWFYFQSKPNKHRWFDGVSASRANSRETFVRSRHFTTINTTVRNRRRNK